MWEFPAWSKKSKKLTEVKSFSSFSFNDIAIDKNLSEVPADLVNISYRYSDPCLLESGGRKVEAENDLVSDYRSCNLSVHKVLSSQYQYQVHSRSVDSWLADYCEEEQIKQDELDIEDTVKSLLKDKIKMEEKKKQKQMGNFKFRKFKFRLKFLL